MKRSGGTAGCDGREPSGERLDGVHGAVPEAEHRLELDVDLAGAKRVGEAPGGHGVPAEAAAARRR